MEINDKNREAFIRGYIDCALWSTTDGSRDDGGDPLDKNYGAEDLSEGTREAMERECGAFLSEHGSLIAEAEHTRYGIERWSYAGHDFWLTRNGHGCGFWDGDWSEPHGAQLTAAAKAAGSVDLYVGDDGQVYQSGAE